MKNKISKSIKLILLLICGIFSTEAASALGSYTAVASGNWSSTATWGGTAPPFTLSAGDQITVSTGITVTMDSTVTVNGALAQLSVAGTLQAAANKWYLNVNTGTLTGAGTINVGHIALGSGGTFSFTGSMTALVFSNSILNLSSTANINVTDSLVLMGVLGVQTGGVLGMGSSSTITVAGGQLSLTGGTLNLSSSYNVNYVSSSSTTGMELSGSGLNNININVGTGNSVTLGNNLTVNDSLELTSGTLILNGDSLVINGKAVGSATITGDASADLTVNTTGGIMPTFTFATGGQTLKNLTINVGSGNSVKVASNLSVNGYLTLTGGSDIDISGQSLTLNGSFSGSGMLIVNSASSLAINSANSIVPVISLFGSAIRKFALNVGSGNTVTLGKAMVVDTLDMQSGTLVLNNNNLTVTGDIVAGGSGAIFSTANSNVTISTLASTSGMLTFSYPGSTVNNLYIVIGAAGSVTMGSDVMIQGTLSFTSGYLNTGNHNVQVNYVSGSNSNSYVITGANGTLTLNATTSAAAYFPVGTADEYLPASITLNAGSSTGTIGVNVSDGVYAQGTGGTLISTSQPMVNATWNFQTNISSSLNYNMELEWAPSSEVNAFVHSNDYISHYTSGNWDATTYAKATAIGGGMYSIQRAGLTSMSPFAVFDSSTAPTGVNTIVNASQFLVYPNPATENINVVNTLNSNKLVYIDVVNMLGQTVSTSEMNNSSTITISLKGLVSGVYFLKFYNEDSTVIEKFVKAE
jgi:hypothetical protein